MSSHHPPRPCFASLQFNDSNRTVIATFTDKSAPYQFQFPDQGDYDAFKAAANGDYFNRVVRNTGVMTFVRL